MSGLFKHITLTITEWKTYDFNKKTSSLNIYTGKWYVNNINEKLLPLKNSHLIKGKQDKEDEITSNKRNANYHWNDYRFQIHWYKLKLVYQKKLNAKKNPFMCHYRSYFWNMTNRHVIGLYMI